MENTVNIRAAIGFSPQSKWHETAPLFGLAIVHAWIYAFNTGGGAAPGESTAWQFVYLPIAATMLALAVACHARPGFASSKIGCAAVSAAGVAAAGLAFIPQSATASAASLILGGVFIGWTYSLWAIVYSRFTMMQATFYLFGSGILAALLKSILFLITPAPAKIALALLAPIALLSGRKACATCSQQTKAALRFTKKDARSLWKVAALIVVFSVVNANLLLLANEQQGPAEMPLFSFLIARTCEIVLCACVLAWTFSLKRPFDFVQLWRIILVLLATDILMRIALPGLWLQPIFSSICVNFIVMFVWLTLCDIAQHSDMKPTTVFGIGWSLYTLPLFAGVTFAQAASGHATESVFLAALLYVVLIVSTFCLELRDRDMQLIFSDINAAAAPAPSEFEDIDARCRAVAEQKRLTPRELEVMQMLCKGRTKAYIAESMFVTENTVKGHTKRLYAKLDVHSKKELQQLIDLR